MPRPMPTGCGRRAHRRRRVPACSAARPSGSSALSDLTNPEALGLHRATGCDRLGVDKALARAGARDGDIVRIGEFSFEYQPDL